MLRTILFIIAAGAGLGTNLPSVQAGETSAAKAAAPRSRSTKAAAKTSAKTDADYVEMAYRQIEMNQLDEAFATVSEGLDKWPTERHLLLLRGHVCDHYAHLASALTPDRNDKALQVAEAGVKRCPDNERVATIRRILAE